MGHSHSKAVSNEVPKGTAGQETEDTAGAMAKLENLMVYLNRRLGDNTVGGVVAAGGALAGVCEKLNKSNLVQVLRTQARGLATNVQPSEAGLLGAQDTMPFAVVMLVDKAADFAPIQGLSAAEAASRDVTPVEDEEAAQQMVGWVEPNNPNNGQFAAIGARILSEVMQKFPKANDNRTDVFLVRVFSKSPLEANFLSFGWMIEESPYHIEIGTGGTQSSVSSDGKVLTLAASAITREALTLACFAENTLMDGIGWCTACDPSGQTLDEGSIQPSLDDFQAKLSEAAQATGVEDAEGHAMTIFKFQCPGTTIESGEAISLSNQACRAIGFLVRRPSASGDKDAQYYVVVEGGAYFLTAAILKVAGEEGSALSWNWPDSTVPIIPTDVYDKPFVYGAVSQEMEAKSISGMERLIAAMKTVTEPCSPISNQDTIVSVASMLLQKGFTYSQAPLTVTGSAADMALLQQDRMNLLTPSIQDAMRSLTPSSGSNEPPVVN